jgi:hypothetical protein
MKGAGVAQQHNEFVCERELKTIFTFLAVHARGREKEKECTLSLTLEIEKRERGRSSIFNIRSVLQHPSSERAERAPSMMNSLVCSARALLLS